MTSLFQKIGLLLGANVHDLVNRALRANSVAVLEEQVRRGQEALEDLSDDIARLVADERIARGNLARQQTDVDRLKANVVILVRAGRESAAAIEIRKQKTAEATAPALEETIADTVAQIEPLRQAQGLLESRIGDLRTARDNTERALRIARSKDKTVRTIEDVTAMLGDDGDADELTSWATQVKVQADVRLEMTLQEHGEALDPTSDPDIAAELERVRASLTAETPV